jgi:hypothetical protein
MTPANQGGSVNDPNYPQNQSWRIEFQMHDWTNTPAGNFSAKIFELDGVGATAWFYPDGVIALGDYKDNITPQQPCFVSAAGRTNVVVRFQRDLSKMQLTCEIWNYDGTGYASQMETILNTIQNTSSGGYLAGGATANLAYLRVYTTIVPLGSRPPVTANGGDWTEWKFENNLNDSSGHSHTANIPGATYANTPNQIAVSLPKTLGAPAWNNWTSLRAGFPAQMDGTASFSLADASSSVNYFWQQISGPSTVRWSDRTSGTPMVTGLVFGTYRFALRVTDTGGKTATTTLDVGAVATDKNGVIVQADPNADKIFGPMIAFGKNPWSYQDERTLRMMNLQIANNPYYATTAHWRTPGQGTVSYPFTGKGPAPGVSCTSITANISATATTIPIANASCLSLSSLPTWILIGNGIGAQELVRICTASATSGPANLGVCYDGRGVAGNRFSGSATVLPAQAWSSGIQVGEMKLAGSGTLFSTDPNSPLCPAGLPGPIGPVSYSSGTVSVTGGSAAITGAGTSWTQNAGTGNTNVVFLTDAAHNAISQYNIRITATHGGGTPFVFWAEILSVAADNGAITLSRPLPADVDPGPFAYKITTLMNLALQFKDADGTYWATQNGMGCESETAAFSVPGHDIGPFDGTTQSGVQYGYKLGIGAQSPFGPNFYGTGLAAYASYLRSGYEPWNTFHKQIDDYWIRDPELSSGWSGGSPLYAFGGVLGGFTNTILNKSSMTRWSDLRPWASQGRGFLNSHHASCNANDGLFYDSRDQGALVMYLTLAEIFDPDAARQAAWNTAMGSAGGGTGVLGRDQRCIKSDGSFAVSIFGAPGPALTMTNGSAIVTGTGFTPGLCAGVATGTITVTHNSASATLVSGALGNAATNYNIFIWDSRSQPNYVGVFEFSFSGPSVTLAGLWPGPSGTFSFVVNDYSLKAGMQVIGIDGSESDDVRLKENWTCAYNSPTQITLNRPWDDAVNGVSGSHPSGTYHMYVTGLSGVGPGGYFQQPFMHGIRTHNVTWAADYSPNATIKNGYAALVGPAGKWMHDVGYDSNTKGSYYARVNLQCEPFIQAKRSTDLPSGTLFSSIHGGDANFTPCGYSGLAGTLGGGNGEYTERVNSQEGFHSYIAYYKAQCLVGPLECTNARNFVDTAYGAIWGDCTLTVNGYPCDNHFVDTHGELSDGSLGAYKWPGFFFGAGMSHQWPALRAGGVEPARNRTVSIAFTLGQAASASIIVTAPSGAVTTYSCGANSPCPITVDDRQGDHWFTIQYLSSTGQVLSQSDPDLLPALR